MHKKYLIITALFCALFFSFDAFAQMDEREPGLYAIVEGESIPLSFSNGTTLVSTHNLIGVEVGQRKFAYSGASSGVVASDKFVLVIDQMKKDITRTRKAYYPFVKSMTPNSILILPLGVDGKRRVYEEGKTYFGINFNIKDRMDFEWEQISDNSFEIRIINLIPGEYGFIFRAARMAEFDYCAIFGFTYPEENLCQ